MAHSVSLLRIDGDAFVHHYTTELDEPVLAVHQHQALGGPSNPTVLLAISRLLKSNSCLSGYGVTLFAA